MTANALEFVAGFSSGPAIESIDVSDSAVNADGPFLVLNFNEAIDQSSLTTDDIILTGPGDIAVAIDSIEPFDPQPDQTSFTSFIVRPNRDDYVDGQYELVIGPNVLDVVGNPMNQDGDQTNGEPLDDQFATTLQWALPDLALSGGSLNLGQTAYQFGTQIDVAYQLGNAGTGTAGGSDWTDRIYLSHDQTLDGDDLSIGELLQTDVLTSGQQLSSDLTVTLPLDVSLQSGTYYLLLSLDDDQQISESDETNVVSSSAIELLFPPLVDLTPLALSGPVTLQPGQTSVFSWSVVNQGDIATDSTWFDQVQLRSVDQPDEVYFVGRVLHTTMTLVPGQSYQSMMTVDLPAIPDGNYLVELVTDWNDRLFEGPYEDNNVIQGTAITIDHADLKASDFVSPATAQSGETIALQWRLANQGTGTAHQWTQRLYLSADGNVSADDRLLDEFLVSDSLDAGQARQQTRDLLLPIDVQGTWNLLLQTDAGETVDVDLRTIEITLAPYADLTVENIELPNEITGDPAEVTVQWTVRNQGTGQGAVDHWTDTVIFSQNEILGDDDDWVAATIQHHSGIDAGQAITYRETILLPAATSGRFNVFVQTDSANEVFENGFEQNNTAVASNTIDVRRALPADLIVSDVVVPVDVDSGTTVDVTWTVQNIGPGITDRGDWYDKVYLATDAAGEHPVEGTETRFQHFGQLGAGGNYVRTGGLVIPHGISGEFFVIVHTAQSNAPYEFIFTGNNQTASPAITVTLSPTPDLTVTDLIVPATAQEGTLIDVQWTVLNDGLATATGGWIDRVYLQEAGNPNAPIIELGQYPFLDPIEPGIRYTRGESIRIPRQTTGVFRIFVDTNAGELLYEATATTNNTKSLPLTIDVNPRPDLQIESISVPERLDAGARLSPSFVVLNQGGRATEGTTWIDRVYLSLDTTVDQADLLIGEFDNGAALAPGERYNTLTDGIIVPLHYRGTVYVLVQTDALDDVDEWPGEDNNVFYEPVIVERDRLADLAVSDVLAPSQVVAGAVVPVRYTVTNLGESETIGETWLENVWLTRDKDRPHPGQGDYVLKSISHSGKLTPGAGYESEVLVTIPETLPSGTWYITPWVDPLDMIPEESLVADQNPDDPTNLDNNNYHSLAVQVLGSQPDLVVTDVDVPATTQAGETIHVEWTVSNLGLADAGPGGWLDRVYLSDRPDPKADDATTMLLAEVKREQPLAEGASYTVVVDVPLSPSASGQYIIVITDDDLPPQPQIDLGSIFGNLIPPQEQFFPVTEVFEDNNLTAVSAEVVATPANLKVVDFDLPSDARSGEEITFSYTVENIGTAPVWSGTKYWKDFVWLSSDPTFIRDRASFLGATVYAPDEILQPGDRYTVSMTTTLPPGTDGDYSLWVHLNANNDQSPFLFPYLARRLDEQFYPADEGENDLWVGHFDHWAFEDPSDNLARAVLPIEYREADLVVTQFDVPNDVTSGETVTLTYTVANQGDRATRIGSWSDRVFISRDDSLDNRDLQVGSTPHFGILEPGQSYTASINARIPDGIEGDFQLILFADSAAQIDRSGRLGDIGFRQVGIEFELPGSLAPWDLASSASRQSARGKVKEYQQEGNNIAAQTTSVTLAMPPDLQVETVTAPLRADRGQSIDVSYVVRNAGGNTVAAQDEWIDLIYLSRDTLLDLSGDIYLGSVEHQDGLAAGEAYSIETTVPLPADLLGPYYVFVITDPDRERFAGDVFEGGLERNNAAHPGTPLLIELPPPVDLEVQSVTVPQNSVTGEAVEFTWTVTNNSNETAEGHWSDSVYLSVDASWNLSDVPVGRVEFEGTLEPGESYTSTLQTWMLSVTPGAYRAIVRTDIFNQVFEADLEGNNTTASPSTMQVTAPRLTLDVPYPTTLLPSQQRLFAVDVPPEQTLRVTVIADDDSSQEVYLRSAVAPTTHQYDASSGGTLASATSAVVPSTIAGTYYVLLDNFAASEAGSSIRVLAELLPLAITDVRTDVGGDSRYVTTTIQGARFHEDAIVKLVRPGFAEYLPVTLNRVSASEIIATFDFDDAPHGLYDVQVINPDGQVAVLPYRFLIQRTIEPEVSVGIGGPRYVFAGDQGTYSVAIENLSNVDAPYVYYSVGIPELGINQNVYNLPYTHFTSNLRGGPEGSLHDLPWAELDSAVNVDGHWTAGGYLFDQAADRSAGFNFQVQTYPGLRELSDHAWEAFKAKLYEAVPLYAEQDLLAEGPSALDQLSPGLSLVWEVFGAVPDLLTQPLIPFQFHVVASATAMTRDEFIAHALAEAETLRSGILNDADADAALVNLAGDQDAWQDLYLAYLTESGRLRAEDVAPPARRDQELASLMATLTGGVMTGPGGDQVILAGTFDDFFANVRRWYGHDPSLTAPLADDLTQFDSDSLSFLGILRSANPVAELPIFDDYDLGLGANTHFQAMRVYVPWVPFGRRSDGIPSEYQINGITPNGEDIFFPLNLQGYYDQLGGVSGAASQTGPFTIETGGFVPAETPLPITVNFQNDPNALRETNEIRVVVPLDENVDPRSFRLGDLKISDLNIRMPDNRSLYQGEFEFADSLGYNVRVSAGVDLQSNTATWLIQAIDPLTGEVRTDGQNGLLPPNDAQGHGAGFVSYSVQIADQATSGATFTARARVLLDNAPADDAEPLTYAIDAQSPISTVNVTPLNNQHDFVVRWQSIDEPEGSGVKHVTIYVAEDGGDFKIWKRQQPGATGEEVFVGRVGHDYEFLALATDLAGNRETPPTGRSTADDGSRVALGTLPAVDTSTSNQLGQPATPRSTPSPNALFTVAENLIPSQVSPSRPSSFATVLQPFAAQQFAGGFANSANAVDSSGIGPMAIAEMPSGDFLVSGGASRNQLYLFSSEGGEADRVWAELDHPIFNLVFDHSERLWATTGGGPLLELDPSDGTVLAEYGDGLTMGLTVDPISGDLFVGSGSGVERFDPETKRFSHFSRDQDLRVGSLAFADDGTLYATRWPQRDAVVKFNALGRAETVLQFDTPIDSIAIGIKDTPLEGLMFVTHNRGIRGANSDNENSELTMVDLASLRQVPLASGGTRGDVVITSSDGNIYVSGSTSVDVLSPIQTPQIIATLPAEQTTTALPLGMIAVAFSEDMWVGDGMAVQSVINPGNYVIHSADGNDPVVTGVRYHDATRTAYVFVSGFQPGDQTLFVGGGIQSAGGFPMASGFEVHFKTVSEFSADVDITIVGTRLNRAEQTLTYDVTITNQGSYDLLLPMSLAFTSNGRLIEATPADDASSDAEGRWIFDLADQVPGGVRLQPGQSTSAKTLRWLVPGDAVTDVVPSFLATATANLRPAFDSVAAENVVAGNEYVYDANANDPDGTAIFYQLLSAPDGMTVDSATGIVRWQTDSHVAAQNDVVLYAFDSRGGFAAQQWTVNVTGGNTPPEFVSPPDTVQLAENETLQLTIDATDIDGDSVDVWADHLPAGAFLDAETKTLWWSPGAASAGTYHGVTLWASDGVHVTSHSFDLLVAAADRPPVIEPVSNATVRQGDLWTYRIQAADPDGDALTFTSDQLPSGATLDAREGVLRWQVGFDSPAVVTIPITVTGGGQSTTANITVDVINANGAPLFDPMQGWVIDEGQTLSITTFAFDPDHPEVRSPNAGSYITYDAIGLPDGATYDSATATLTWTPDFDQAGEYAVEVFATDDGDGTGNPITIKTEIPITVRDVNHKPLITPVASLALSRGSRVDLPIEVVDLDGDTIELQVANGLTGLPLPKFATFTDHGNGTGVIQLAPGTGDRGNYTFSILAQDDGGGGYRGQVAQSQYDFVVTIESENDPPVIETVPALVAVAGERLRLPIQVSDIDQEPLEFSISGLPPQARIVAGARYGEAFLNWDPTTADLGHYDVTVSATDSGNGVMASRLTASQTFSLDVRATNQSPMLNAIPTITIGEGEAFARQLSATDPDSDSVHFAASNLPDGAMFDPITGWLRWTPSFDQAGIYTIPIKATDGSASDQRNVEIIVDDVNRAPKLAYPAMQYGREGSELLFRVRGDDFDGGPLNLVAENLPSGATFDSSTRRFRWVPGYDQAGTYNVRFTLTDEQSASDTISVPILVSNTNRPPTIEARRHQVLVGESLTTTIVASDSDADDQLTYSAYGLPEGATLNASSGQIEWVPNPGQVGSYYVDVRVSDGLLESQSTLVIECVASARVPNVVIVTTPSFPARPGQVIQVQVIADGVSPIDTLSLTYRGNPVTLDASGKATITAGGPGKSTLVATATDEDGFTGTTSELIRVRDLADDQPPVVSLNLPSLSKLSNQADLAGTIDDAQLERWTLTVQSLATGRTTTIASGDTTVLDEVIAQIDPREFANGFYRITLDAQDIQGRESATNVFVEIDTAEKIDAFTRTDLDAAIEVDGKVFEVSRQYDSLSQSWRPTFRSLGKPDLMSTGSASDLESLGIYSALSAGDRIYISLPDGTRAGFTFAPEPSQPFASNSSLVFYKPLWIADTGVEYELQSLDRLLVRGGNRFYDQSSGQPYHPANTLLGADSWRLTHPDGKVDVADANGVIVRTVWPDGTTWHLSDSGVQLSDGVFISTQFDPQGNLTAIRLPSGVMLSGPSSLASQFAGLLTESIDLNYRWNDEGALSEVLASQPASNADEATLIEVLHRYGYRADDSSALRLPSVPRVTIGLIRVTRR
ncbi:hypothetical protein C2E31_12350 [Rhodopirellula baltica]|nr:hypothetical protein C2E31_12350 [Rhodopirellula baltica]